MDRINETPQTITAPTVFAIVFQGVLIKEKEMCLSFLLTSRCFFFSLQISDLLRVFSFCFFNTEFHSVFLKLYLLSLCCFFSPSLLKFSCFFLFFSKHFSFFLIIMTMNTFPNSHTTQLFSFSYFQCSSSNNIVFSPFFFTFFF